jgi:hypothetical protein
MTLTHWMLNGMPVHRSTTSAGTEQWWVVHKSGGITAGKTYDDLRRTILKGEPMTAATKPQMTEPITLEKAAKLTGWSRSWIGRQARLGSFGSTAGNGKGHDIFVDRPGLLAFIESHSKTSPHHRPHRIHKRRASVASPLNGAQPMTAYASMRFESFTLLVPPGAAKRIAHLLRMGAALESIK